MQEKAPVTPGWWDMEKALKILAVALYVGALLIPYAISSSWRVWIRSGNIYSDPPPHWQFAVLAMILLSQLSWIYYALQRSKGGWHSLYVGVSVLTMGLVLSGFLLEPGKWFLSGGHSWKDTIFVVLGGLVIPMLLFLSIFLRSSRFKGFVVILMPFSVAAAMLWWIIPTT